MEMTVIGSSSRGNGYVLQNGDEALIIEAGMPLKDVKKAVSWNIAKVKGCIVTHRHNDHAGHVKDYEKAGIAILAPSDVIESKQLGHRAHEAVAGKGYRLGGFKVMPFRVEHDVPCLGYLISHAECGRIVFATDTYVLGSRQEDGSYMHYTFRDVNHWMIETNYTTWIVDRNIRNGNLTPSMKQRLMVSHLSLHNAIRALQRQDLTPCREILLIHMSDGNSDEKMFVKKVRDATGKRAIPAKPYLTIDYTM